MNESYKNLLKSKPQKGKAFDQLPKKTLETFEDTLYAVSTKFDGNQIFITKTGDKIEFFTSDWKQFDMPLIAERYSLLLRDTADCIIVSEMNYGEGRGKLGDRTTVQGKITTERVNFKKGLGCSLDESKVVINTFDFIEADTDSLTYAQRHDRGSTIGLSMVDIKVMTGKQAVAYVKALVHDGWEGGMLIEPDSLYQAGKRVNYSIKLKYRKTADLLCVGTEEGEGKYEGMIGSLVLQDKKGRIVKVGSGLSDNSRGEEPSYFIGKVIEIEYEQILDTYIQPTLLGIRFDKTKEETD